MGEVAMAIFQMASLAIGGRILGVTIESGVVPLEFGSVADNLAKVVAAILGAGAALTIGNFFRPFNIANSYRTLVIHNSDA